MRYFLIVFAVLALIPSARAVPITFTGAELASLPGASFPTGGQMVIGDDLRIDATEGFTALYRLDLDEFIIDRSDFGFSLEFTRLNSDSGLNEQEFFIGFFDGRFLYSASFFGRDTGQTTAQNIILRLNEDGTELLGPGFAGASSPTATSSIGDILQLDFRLQATLDDTIISHAFDGSDFFPNSTLEPLLPGSDLSLVIFNFNNTEQNFLFNSLTFTNGVSAVPEPGALGGLGLGMLALTGFMRRRRTI